MLRICSITLFNHSSLQTDELHALVNTSAQINNDAETQRFSYLSEILTRRTTAPPIQPVLTLSTSSIWGPKNRRNLDVFRALACVAAARPANQVNVVPNRAGERATNHGPGVADAPHTPKVE